jgi:hypothetical protein
MGVKVETVAGSLGMGYRLRLTKLLNVHNPNAFTNLQI